MAKIIFTKVCCINKHCIEREYTYSVEVLSNTGKAWRSYDHWTAYQKNAKDAKSDIITRMNESQALDYIMDDMIIKDNSGFPFFVPVNN